MITLFLASAVFAAPIMFDAAKAAERQSEGVIDLLRKVGVWGCQFQNLDPKKIAMSELDLIVVDPILNSRDIAAEVVQSMKRRPDGRRRLVMAYLSLGEAENYRDYWQDEWSKKPPSWMGPENPNWPNNFVVRYWDPDWQTLQFGQPNAILDRIIRAGFDGVFLDRVDAYADWEEENTDGQDQMIHLVSSLAKYAREKVQNFLVMAQNAEELLSDPRYLRTVNGINKEDLFFGLSGPEIPNTEPEVKWSLVRLRAAQQHGMEIFAIEYLHDEQKISIAKRRFSELGFRPFFGHRMLDRMPGVLP